jgi:hypothetical protein
MRNGSGPALEQSPHRPAGDCMKHILDSDFRYRPSFDTDVKKTFEKIRRQQQQAKDEAKDREHKARSETQVKVLKLEQLKKATTSA